MRRIAAIMVAVVLLSGFTEQEALDRFAGGWQMADEIHGTGGAIQIDAGAKTIKAAAFNELIEGPFAIEILGASAIFRVGEKTVIVFSGPDTNSIEARIGSVPSMRFVRVP